MPAVVGERSQRAQCRNRPSALNTRGTSGSKTMSTTLFAAAGTPLTITVLSMATSTSRKSAGSAAMARQVLDPIGPRPICCATTPGRYRCARVGGAGLATRMGDCQNSGDSQRSGSSFCRPPPRGQGADAISRSLEIRRSSWPSRCARRWNRHSSLRGAVRTTVPHRRHRRHHIEAPWNTKRHLELCAERRQIALLRLAKIVVAVERSRTKLATSSGPAGPSNNTSDSPSTATAGPAQMHSPTSYARLLCADLCGGQFSSSCLIAFLSFLR